MNFSDTNLESAKLSNFLNKELEDITDNIG